METSKSSSVVAFFVFSLVSVSLATAFKAPCMNKALKLRCPVQDSSSSGQHLWKYKENLYDPKWHIIGSHFSENNYSLSPNIPRKFEGITNVLEDRSLVIQSFVPELSGIYDCQWNHEGKIDHNMVTVVAVNCEKTVCEGDPAIVECDLLRHRELLSGLDHPSEIEWKQGHLKKTKLISMGPGLNASYQKYSHISVIEGVGALRIESASTNISGQQYTCVVHGGKGATKKQHSVTIKVKKCQKKIDSYEGEKTDLECPYYRPLARNTKNITLVWYYKSTKIVTLVKNQGHAMHSLLVKINGTNGMITLVSPGIFDSGRYTCKVFREKELLAEHSVTLNVTRCHIVQPNPRNNILQASTEKPQAATEANTTTKGKAEAEAEAEAKTKAKAKAKAKAKRKVRDIVVLVIVGVFVVIVLPICLYYMARRRRPQHGQPVDNLL